MLHYALALVAALILAACAALPEGPAPGSGGFELDGRVAVRYGSEGASGRISWRHSTQVDEMLITSFLGQGVARITRQGNEFVLVAEGKEHRAPDAESLTEGVLGWRLPLTGLPDWIQGRPSPGRPSEVRRDAAGRVASLTQDGWQVEYQEFEKDRPSRLRLCRPNLEIRVIVDRWSA